MKSGEMRRAIEYLPTTAFATKTYCEPLLKINPPLQLVPLHGWCAKPGLMLSVV